MKYYPILLDVRGRNCLVVGGGEVGARKAVTLEKCGANVKVISDRFSDRFDRLTSPSLSLEKKEYEKKDVTGMLLVLAATNNAELNRQIKEDAAEFNIFCNVADAPENSDFLLPAVVDRGDLIVAVSTSGSSPAMAKKIRQELETLLGPEYAEFLILMGNIRKKLLSSGHAPKEHKQLFHALIDKGILELIKTKDEISINLILGHVLGKEYMYQDLVSSRSDE